ncbi:MAG: cytochrome c family protein [Candidatus Eisenbacteria bacterium]|uniref:Cytochrome c family protein n=1 Tax=Eiseniibacteriota bacterium TaxID=2212470 RepID=A0A948W3V3_UNCEI|nr:cytochrome c family protein [Candidatus Eisenbacteria bacterium]MBU1950281.1 cytochrome c family protein [Candidatus Eisenbacteria bacterium]MBU2691507.1 cytochrome c family protein [Candidatus Eisenbacteria bacterium]
MVAKAFFKAVCHLVGIGVILLFYPVISSAHDPNEPSDLDCMECHTCEEPTLENMCLKACPRLASAHKTAGFDLSKSPDILKLDDLADLYEATLFNHKGHAEMTDRGIGCEVCHHYSTSDDIPLCSDCHVPGNENTNLRMPGLKGAFHRLCLGCHREWSHETECDVCHVPAKDGALEASGYDRSDIIGREHPKLVPPVTKILQVDFAEGPVVRFPHAEHVESFGFECVDCHQNESCDQCHDLQRSSSGRDPKKAAHADCKACHEDDKCSKCHTSHDSAEPLFNHEAHAEMTERGVGCKICHHDVEENDIQACSACHTSVEKGAHMGQPSLQGAYHRLCLGCHREWDHETRCTACHHPSQTKDLEAAGQDPTDIVGQSHPKLIPPITKVFQTNYKEGPVVRFAHSDHIEKQGFECVDCHQKESCNLCHDLAKDPTKRDPSKEHHEDCNACHAGDECVLCHKAH